MVGNIEENKELLKEISYCSKSIKAAFSPLKKYKQ